MAARGYTNSSFRLKTKVHPKIKPDDVIALFQTLSTLLSAGTPLLRSLRSAGEQSESKKLSDVCRVVTAEIAGGVTLATARDFIRNMAQNCTETRFDKAMESITRKPLSTTAFLNWSNAFYS